MKDCQEYGLALAQCNELDFIKMLRYYDVLTDECLIMFNTQFGNNFLTEYKQEFLEFVRTTPIIKDNPSGYIINNNRFFEWDYTESEVRKIKIGKLINSSYLTLIRDSLLKLEDAPLIEYPHDNQYHISLGHTDIELIELLIFYDVITLECLLYIRNKLNCNILENSEYNKILLYHLNRWMWDGFMDNRIIQNNNRFFCYIKTRTKVLNIKFGYIIDDKPLTIIEGNIEC